MAFYIEQGTGRQVDSSNLSSINPNSTYIESGTGKSLLGSALTPKPQVSATQALSYVFGAPKPVTTLSSTEGQKIVNTNANKLSSLETALSGATLGTAPAVNIKPGMPGLKMEGEQPAITGPLKSTSSSPAQQTMVQDINQAISTGGLSVEQAQALKDLMSAQDEITSAAANAKMAQESGDYKAMNDYVKLIEERQKAYQDNLTAYYASVKDLRAQLANSLSPTAREYELNRKINDVRAQAEAFKTQTEEDKFREYEGQTLGFAGGRASEIDIRAEFKMQRMAQEEKALLADLGLEQDMRKSQKEGIEAQLGYLSDDFELQNKANDKINELEDKIIERADSLQGEAKNTLITILDSLGGVDIKSLDQGTLMKLEQMAVDAGIPFDLLVASLDAQYKRQVYEDSVKARTSSKEYSVSLTPTDKQVLIAGGFTASEIQALEEEVSTNGIDSVLAKITDPKKRNAITEVYGAEKTYSSKEEMKSVLTPKIARDKLEETFTDTELREMAKAAGFSWFFNVSDTELEKYLDSERAVEDYLELWYAQAQSEGRVP